MSRGSISLKQVTEEIVTSSGQSVILQADGERSTRQILRAVQHCRAQLGLSTEIRTTGKGQHASNGQAERTVQTCAAWLVTRYRVINGSTSFELMTDRKYSGRLVLFGESVMYKDITSLKGEPVYKRGVWVGRSTWSDSHIVLRLKGAVEARSIRRLPQQFHAEDMVAARGLPWNYSAQGILMKHRSTVMRPALEVEEVAEDEEERRAKQGNGLDYTCFDRHRNSRTGSSTDSQEDAEFGTPEPRRSCQFIRHEGRWGSEAVWWRSREEFEEERRWGRWKREPKERKNRRGGREWIRDATGGE